MITTRICENSRHQRSCSVRKKNPLAIVANFFKRNHKEDHTKCCNKNATYGFMDPSKEQMEDVSFRSQLGLEEHLEENSSMNLRVGMTSPTLSTITLTPGRTRDIDLDMQALRLSRQDNPYLQVLASRESLVDSIFEPDNSDDVNLMDQEFDSEIDPLSLPEIHEHMIRSPPPTTWPRSPNFRVFRFPDEAIHQENSTAPCGGSVGKLEKYSFNSSDSSLRPSSNIRISRPHQRLRTTSTSSSEYRLAERVANQQQLGQLNKLPVRSLSDVRRNHIQL